VKKISHIPLSYIVLINLALKLVMFCYIGPWDKAVENNTILVSDSKGYQQVAENLLHSHSFAPLKDTVDINKFSELRATGYLMSHPDGWMMPAYAVFLAGIYSVAGIKPYVAILIQIMLSLISVILVYRICTLLFKQARIATITALLFALDIHSIYAANELLTETLFVLFFLAGVYYFLIAMMQGKLSTFAIGAAFMGLASLTRLIALMYPLLLVFILLIFSRQKIQWKLKAILLYTVIFAFLNSLWLIRNYTCYGHWQITTHGGWALAMYNASLTEENRSRQNLDSIRVSFQKQADSMGFRKSRDIFVQSDIYQKIGSKYIANHKAIYVVTILEGNINMFLSLGNRSMAKTLGWCKTGPAENFAGINPQKIKQNFSSGKKEAALGIIIIIILLLQYVGAIYGIIKLVIERNFMVLSLVVFTAIYFAVITGPFGEYRFKLPVVPFICIAAGYGYSKHKSNEKLMEAIPSASSV